MCASMRSIFPPICILCGFPSIFMSIVSCTSFSMAMMVKGVLRLSYSSRCRRKVIAISRFMACRPFSCGMGRLSFCMNSSVRIA